MGTPEFAVPTLDILIKNGYNVVCTVTATDKLGGRGGKQVLQSAVKQYAVAHNLPVLQPEKLRNPEFINALRSYDADLFIVVAFRMLPEIVWTMPRLGTMNLHGSLLPKYRGAAPINWAIINGEKETGVTTFFLKHEIDTGDIFKSAVMSIGDDENAGSVHDRMMLLGAETVLESVQDIVAGKLSSRPQANTEATHAPKIFHETCELDARKTTQAGYDFVRGLSPYPTAWILLNGMELKIFSAEKEIITPEHTVGTIVSDNKSFLKITTLDGYLKFTDVQLAGRKRMDIKAFLAGYKH